MKEYVKGIHKFIVTKNEKGLYDYEMQEYSEICNVWIYLSKDNNYPKEVLEEYLNIKIDF